MRQQNLRLISLNPGKDIIQPMSRQITFKNSQKAQYCQIKLDDGKRIFISVAEGKVRVSTMKWFGAFPNQTISEFDVMALLENTFYQNVLRYLRENKDENLEFSAESLKYGFNQLDVFRVVLLRCLSLPEVEKALSKFR